MKDKEFYVSYIEGSLGSSTKKRLKRFVLAVLVAVFAGALTFGFFQKPFKNSTFELSSETKISGVFHESPYPMLRVQVAENEYKNVLLLGFGKFSANSYLKEILTEVDNLNGKTVTIEGNLIYYNGKTLIQITDEQKVILEKKSEAIIPTKERISNMTLQGEIIDPKCFFGVMKPGFGKIHRSCAVRCISGGIPPVLATSDNNNISEYYLITDQNGNAIHKEVLSFIGKPSAIKGVVERLEDWYILKINTSDISILNETSTIY